MKREIIQCRVPEHWLSYLINFDESGYEDSEIDEILNWISENQVSVLCDVPESDDYTLFQGLLTKTVLVDCIDRFEEETAFC
jgi:hypothetical protein